MRAAAAAATTSPKGRGRIALLDASMVASRAACNPARSWSVARLAAPVSIDGRPAVILTARAAGREGREARFSAGGRRMNRREFHAATLAALAAGLGEPAGPAAGRPAPGPADADPGDPLPP